ncbi:hypothetical protein AADZ90_005040 [Aestuariibius sp. 2305UL40-4]|uniref:hypothetical protein n=1 Tax=Aestuariibius violaceus TaxID=3234132 RepID=UPI00398F2F07
MGIVPLRPVIDGIRPQQGRPLVLFTTHAHVDHISAAHGFDIRLAIRSKLMRWPVRHPKASMAMRSRTVCSACS